MEKQRYYSLWFQGYMAGLTDFHGPAYWSTMSHPTHGTQNSDEPFLLSRQEAQDWFETIHVRSRHLYQIREVEDAEAKADRRKREAHADRYL